jgi:hypothetical protein
MPEAQPIGALFPAGGRVSPDQMIAREGDVADLAQRLREFTHVALSGPRRIGKTTVCGAVCARLRDGHGMAVVEVEVPEQSSAEGVCQLVIDRTARLDLERAGRRVLRTTAPLIKKLLEAQGIPLDLSEFGSGVPDRTRRAVLELPLQIARRRGEAVVFFLDELQRAVDYADGEGLVNDLVDIYAGSTEVVVLVDGSDERTIEQLMGRPFGLGKLAQRIELAQTIPSDQWRGPLRERFERAGLAIAPERLEQVLGFGAGRPYDTMTACRYVAINARRLEIAAIDDFALERGLEEARARLDEDR